MIRDLSIFIWLILGFTPLNLILGDAFLASPSLSTLIADLLGVLKYDLVKGSLSNVLGSMGPAAGGRGVPGSNS